MLRYYNVTTKTGLPMNKNFTLTNKLNSLKSQPGPKESSINFIKQFARACSIKKMNSPELGIFVMN
jgi:hypothetical protein